MKKNKISLRFFFSSLMLTLLFGCTKLLFENTVPNQGEIIQVLPEFLSGSFHADEDQIFYDVERVNEKHCIIYGRNWIQKDSIYALVESLKNDSTYVEFKESMLIIKQKDTTERIKLRLDDDVYYTEKEPVYELNLDKGYFIDDFENNFKKKALLKFYNGKYFLNTLDEQDNWFAIWFENKSDRLILHNSFIADTLFTERLPYYNGITKIEKLQNKTYVTNPSDKELFNLLAEPSLFEQEVWMKLREEKGLGGFWTVFGISFIVLFALYLIITRRKKSMDPNYKKFFLRTFIIALTISALIGIVIFLVGEFGETEMKILATTLAIGGFSITALGCSTVHDIDMFRPFSLIGMLISVFGFLFTVSAIWALFESDHEWVAQAVFTFVILSVSTAHISLLLQIRAKTRNIKYALIATIIFISIVAAMLIKATINDFEDSDLFFRLLGVFAILDVLGTIATPILNRTTEKLK
jgi:uncharacterized membrane protein YfcA